MRYFILASGSRGNAIYIESQYGRFLIDAGISARKIEERLKDKEIDPPEIEAIILTHAHRDHVRGVGVFANRYQIPVIGHPDTLDSVTNLLKPQQKIEPWTEPFNLKDLHFVPFRVYHDCDPTFGYLIRENSKTLVLCTDLGFVSEEVKTYVGQANAILLESNHDSNMLMNGFYPWHLKERIAGRTGHLSNDNAGELLKESLNLRTSHVMLGHLSEENNTPELALQTVLNYVGHENEAMIEVIGQRMVSDMFDL